MELLLKGYGFAKYTRLLSTHVINFILLHKPSRFDAISFLIQSYISQQLLSRLTRQLFFRFPEQSSVYGSLLANDRLFSWLRILLDSSLFLSVVGCIYL